MTIPVALLRSAGAGAVHRSLRLDHGQRASSFWGAWRRNNLWSTSISYSVGRRPRRGQLCFGGEFVGCIWLCSQTVGYGISRLFTGDLVSSRR